MNAVADKPSKSGKRSVGRPPSDKPLRNHVGVKLPDELARALQDYQDSLAVETSDPAVMRAALERFLEEEGFWPRKSRGDE
jgi:hypothetical protein